MKAAHGAGRLRSRPRAPAAPAPGPGLHRLGLEAVRDGLLHVPESYRPDQPAPVVVMLHGAGGDAAQALAPLLAVQASRPLLLLAPDSRGRTWDLLLGGYGADVAFIDRALAHTFARLATDQEQVTVAGFSDGASYALSLGLTNGDLFGGVIAFSPGFMSPAELRGRPRLFVSHGRSDPVLSIAGTSRKLVPRLRQTGYEVHYREFDGGHTVPPRIVEEALAWVRDKEA